MMNDLIQITKTQIDGIEVNSVNLRDLHKQLKSKRQFADFAKGRLGRFSKNEDYVCISQKSEKGNKPLTEYIVTIDTAKMIAMMENNEVGDYIRKYFVEVEKQNTINPLQLPQNYIEALKALTMAEEQKQRLSETIKAKDEIILVTADLNIKAGHVSFSDFSKNLALENMGRNNVIKFCKAKGILMGNTEPYQPYIKRGYFVRKPSKEKIDGEVRYKTMLTPRGTVWLARVIKAEYEID